MDIIITFFILLIILNIAKTLFVKSDANTTDNEPNDISKNKYIYIDIKNGFTDSIKYFKQKYPSFDTYKMEQDIKAEYSKMCIGLQLNKPELLQNVCTKHFIESKAYSDVPYNELDVTASSNSCKILWIGYNKEYDNLQVKISSKRKVINFNNKKEKELPVAPEIINQQLTLIFKYIGKNSTSDDRSTIGVHCKKCGAPYKNISNHRCAYCGAEIEIETDINYNWLIDDIYLSNR